MRSGKRRRIGHPSVSADNGDLTEVSDTFSRSPNSDVTISNQTDPVIHTNKPKNSVVRKMEQTVLFKPKATQSTEVTKKDIREKFDPITFGVKDMRYRENGEVAVVCGSIDQALKLVCDAQSLLSESYDIEKLKALKPRLKIVGMNEEFSETEIIDKMKKQNNLPANADLKVIRMRKQTQRDGDTTVLIIEADASSFSCLMKDQRVNIGWDRCRVYEIIDVLRCFKCSEYGHKAAKCNKVTCCPKCSQGHPVSECESNVANCINCQNFNISAKLSAANHLKTDHPAWSSDCPVYQKQLKKSKFRIDYSI